MNMNTHKYEYSSLNIHIFMNKSRGKSSSATRA
jgi:hypothetical protein